MANKLPILQLPFKLICPLSMFFFAAKATVGRPYVAAEYYWQ